MYHLILSMPIVGLVAFWIWPFPIAMPIYLVILLVSGVIYFKVGRSMQRPVTTGSEAMLGGRVEVIDMNGHEGRVRFNGATWNAVSDDSFRPGDRAQVLAVDGLTLKIGKVSPPSPEQS